MASLVHGVDATDCWAEIEESLADSTPDWDAKQKDIEHPGSRHRGPERRLNWLVHTIEGEIIPRLMLAHKAVPDRLSPTALGRTEPGPNEVAEFSGLVLADDPDLANVYVEAMRERGVALETIYLELLAPTARRLGELWEADQCTFAEVTVGLSRLHRVLRDLGFDFEHEVDDRERGPRALLVPAPGEQHSFGLIIVEEFLRRAGWDVWAEPSITGDDLVGIVRSEWFEIVGMSVSCDNRLDKLALDIRAMRRASRNPAIAVMVGGRVFVEHPELAARVGADATANDARQAAQQAESLLDLFSQRLSASGQNGL